MSEAVVQNAAVTDTTKTEVPKPGTPAPEPVTPEIPNAKKPDEMSTRFAALAKRERMFRINSQRAKEREAKIAERERMIAERERQWDEEFRTAPLEAIKKRGYSYEDITKAALNDGKFDPATEVKSVKDEVTRLRQEQAEREKRAQEEAKANAARAEAEAIEVFKGRISETIDAQKDKYELCHLYEATDLVYQTVEEHWNRTKKDGKGKILSVDEACELVEQYLESEIDRMAEKSKKFQSKYKSGAPKEDPKAQPKTTTTITNELNSTAPSLLPSATEQDRMKRALAKLSGNAA